ncbi:uncharacterized protein K02A2.6-like [Lytechinus pictus]|uniref:uncharacterized protein K02A2.6-like n=1 Tax=Lytechinus pictus TaxID=7653 RepID=UPI0030B9E789
MDGMRPPEAFSLQGNITDNWKRWKQRFELYLTASGLDKKDSKVQTATLLHIIGEEALEIYNTFSFEQVISSSGQPVAPTLKDLLEKFTVHFEPQSNVTFERHVFNTRFQHENESFDQFVTDLKKKAKSCEFEHLRDSLIKDRIVVGIRDDGTRARLLREKDLSLEKAIDICKATEITSQHIAELKPKQNIHAMQATSMNRKTCPKCGNKHPPRKCPAYGKECHTCKKKNHFSSICRDQDRDNDRDRLSRKVPFGGQTRNKKGHRPSKRGIHDIKQDSEYSDADSEEFHVDAINGVQQKEEKSKKEWYVNLTFLSDKNRHKEKATTNSAQFKIDTGAQCNILAAKAYKKLGMPKFGKSKARLMSYTEHVEKSHLGKCTLTCVRKNKFHNIEFEVIDRDAQSILGLESSELLGFVKRADSIKDDNLANQYTDVFEGLGCMGEPQHLDVDKSISPTIHPPRKVPVAIKQGVKNELNRMEEMGVIVKQTEPTQWVSSMVTVAKKGKNKVRICLDPRDLNKAIKRPHYPMKTIDDITDNLAGAQIFSTLDANCGFWQIPLDDESSKLLTFNTPYGRYRFLRLPFGINSASEIFQRIMTDMFSDIEGVEVLVDDILIYGPSESVHDQRLKQVLERCREKCIKLNPDKCHIRQTQVTYMGHIVSTEGLKPDPKKIEAITKMPTPQSKKGVQQFLGMVNYLGKFIPNLTEKSAPIRVLLEKDVAWHWDDKKEASFKALKEAVTNAPVLKYYDVSKPVKLSVDASQAGTGAVLLQNGHPVAYASKAFTDAQTRYAQIEKELAAIVFGCKKFHQYIFGRTVDVETDHKPLETIFKKPLHASPPRLQKMLLNLQKYDLRVTYEKGVNLFISDCLSRNFLANQSDDVDVEEIPICIIDKLPIADERMKEIKDETKKDETLQKLRKAILTGWPNEKREVSEEIRQYWEYRELLTVEDELICKDARVIIPKSLRKKMIGKVHGHAHQGIEKTKKLARDIMYWPGMSAQIADIVASCEICNTYKQNNANEPMIGHTKPDQPWQKIGSDILELNGKYHLILVDYYSSFFELCELKNMTTSTVIKHCKEHFARYGIPSEFVSDNGPCYASSEFKKFSEEYKFKHVTSSPGYPKSNGKAESAVKIAKNLLRKSSDIHLALLQYRNTPLEGLDASPAQLLMGRRTRTPLPTNKRLLKPKTQQNINTKLKKQQEKQKMFYDKTTHTLPNLVIGDVVRMRSTRNPKIWQKAIVVRICKEPRSYIVQAEGVDYRRNRKDLNKTKESLNPLHQNDEYNNQTQTSHDNPPNTPQNTSQRTTQPKQGYTTKYGRHIKPPERYGT